MDTIDGMRTFAAVATEGSFTGAARRLNITTKLASKYVRQLEERLSAQLFNRTTRSVTLTDVGRAYLERCLPLLDQFDDLEAVVQERQTDLSGTIRLTAPTAFGSANLVAGLEPFLEAHPDVSLDLHLTDQRVSLVEDGFDLGIRFGGLEDSTLIARRLISMRVVVCAAPSYLARHGRPDHPKALATHRCIIQPQSTLGPNWAFRERDTDLTVRVPATHKANSPRACAEMAALGIGITRCPIYVTREHVAAGRLQILFEDMETEGFALYAVYPPNRHLTARVRALIDHLAVSLSENG